jgi:hypothetical protein
MRSYHCTVMARRACADPARLTLVMGSPHCTTNIATSYIRLVMRSYHCTTMARIFVCGSGYEHGIRTRDTNTGYEHGTGSTSVYKVLTPGDAQLSLYRCMARRTCADPARLTLVMRSYHCTTNIAMSYIRLVMRSYHCTTMARIFVCGSGEAHRYLAPKATIRLVMGSPHCTTSIATCNLRLVTSSLHCTNMARISCAGPAWLTDIGYHTSQQHG